MFYTSQAQAAQAAPQPASPPASMGGNFFTGAFDMLQSTLDNASADPVASLSDSNVQAFLTLIRTGEGTLGDQGYSELFGGGHFSSFADHPNIPVPFGNTYSTAAGAYQMLYTTWKEMQAQYNLPDFSPSSQDIAAVGLIKRRGALGDVIAGRFATAIDKCNKEWASLPNSPYGQPTITMSRAANVLASAGGNITEAMA